MKEIMVEYNDWVGFDQLRAHGGSIKVLDYCAGTGFLSQALAPHVNKVLAMDNSQNMTIQYNKRAEQTQEDHPDCEMRAVLGDLIYGKVPTAEIPSHFVPFDLVAMCVSLKVFTHFIRSLLTSPKLAVDFFAPDDASDDDAPGLARALASLTSRLGQNGVLLILDIEKDYTGDGANGEDNEDYQAKSERTRNGKKIVGYGSDEVRTALEALGMEDIVVQGDLCYENPLDDGQVYFLLKARKGDVYQEQAAGVDSRVTR